MKRYPTYLRVSVGNKCSLKCSYCHKDGDWREDHQRLSTDQLAQCLCVAVRVGIKKIKFLGGEPLLYPHVVELVKSVRKTGSDVDLSIITNGVAPLRRIKDFFDSGLDRANLSIHGFSLSAFSERGGNARAYLQRQKTLDYLLKKGKALKLNYVYTDVKDEPDIAGLLNWAEKRPVVVALLDNLHDKQAGSHSVFSLVQKLRGPWEYKRVEEDPHSLPTSHIQYADGLKIEVKTNQLGEFAPWHHCLKCLRRPDCREGIFALRLTDDGLLKPCMNWENNQNLSVVKALDTGFDYAVNAWHEYISSIQR